VTFNKTDKSGKIACLRLSRRQRLDPAYECYCLSEDDETAVYAATALIMYRFARWDTTKIRIGFVRFLTRTAGRGWRNIRSGTSHLKREHINKLSDRCKMAQKIRFPSNFPDKERF